MKMSFFNILNKKKVPSELPALSLNEIPQTALPQKNVVAPTIVPKTLSYAPLPTSPAKAQATPLPAKSLVTLPLEVQPVIREMQASSSVYEKSREIVQEERGFFKDLLKNVTEETKNIEKLEDWYENRFRAEDMVTQMKGYWEEQKPQLIINNVGNDLKAKMLEKTDKLHKLEKEWQESYARLLIKEEEIRSEERELKGVLAEFVDVCKKHLGKESKKNTPRSKDK